MKKLTYFLALTGFAFFQSCEEECKTCGVQVVEESDPTGYYNELAQAAGFDSYADYIQATLNASGEDLTEELCGEDLDAAEAGTGDYAPVLGVGYSLVVTCD